ncbi:RNase P modulator RnpM [Pseudoramibacter sp.]|jgi:predicted RNA-binding protein YlxR (DUF448 family)|uniref:RNase P modulator RnpM n=1 Tax=Pseudoramibacter sp. TaxID=2034862 RepID=UPI0025E08575|nr:YlxR family protein [Pseudoramibacter sp.]MCH4072820.1 YlxR family protein [Pseudoramibacter sp.]MCH4106591.1 YlxR family protein [Pseudoramibacter sp.]
MKKIPQRTCIVCKEKKAKKQLYRIVLLSSGELILDRTGKQNGRGAYVCSDFQCINKLNASLLSKAFKQKVSLEMAEKLKKILYEETKMM